VPSGTLTSAHDQKTSAKTAERSASVGKSAVARDA